MHTKCASIGPAYHILVALLYSSVVEPRGCITLSTDSSIAQHPLRHPSRPFGTGGSAGDPSCDSRPCQHLKYSVRHRVGTSAAKTTRARVTVDSLDPRAGPTCDFGTIRPRIAHLKPRALLVAKAVRRRDERPWYAAGAVRDARGTRPAAYAVDASQKLSRRNSSSRAGKQHGEDHPRPRPRGPGPRAY